MAVRQISRKIRSVPEKELIRGNCRHGSRSGKRRSGGEAKRKGLVFPPDLFIRSILLLSQFLPVTVDLRRIAVNKMVRQDLHPLRFLLFVVMDARIVDDQFL